MKIVQISSLWERTPPEKYGGLEVVVSNLTEELVRRGHKVTLFATGDSQTSATLKSVYPRALYRDGVPWTSMYDTLTHLEAAVRYAKDWGAEIIHNHLSHRSLAMISLSDLPSVHTIHGVLDPKIVSTDVLRTFNHYRHYNYLSISDFQRCHATFLNWIATVYNGIEIEKFEFNDRPKADYLLWIGRFTSNKAPHLAIKYAKKIGMRLLMAAKLDQNAPKDLEYFKKSIKPELKAGEAEWLGEVGHEEKNKLYGNALAFLNPIQWDEPFGLTVTESMACGTPVVAYRRGSMSELITNQQTGFLVKPDDENGFIEAVKKVGQISRATCRQAVEGKFSVQTMTDGYEAVYQKVLGK